MTKHRMSKTRLYRLWVSMKERCYQKKKRSYELYGARDITVCDEWKHDFTKFRN